MRPHPTAHRSDLLADEATLGTRFPKTPGSERPLMAMGVRFGTGSCRSICAVLRHAERDQVSETLCGRGHNQASFDCVQA